MSISAAWERSKLLRPWVVRVATQEQIDRVRDYTARVKASIAKIDAAPVFIRQSKDAIEGRQLLVDSAHLVGDLLKSAGGARGEHGDEK